MEIVLFSLSVLCLAIWVGLLCFRGQFWLANQRLGVAATELELWPNVCAVVPARNEARLLPATLRSLLCQNYPGTFSIILVDDNSTDETASIARQIARQMNGSQTLEIISAPPLPTGWTGKLWAMERGIRYAENLTAVPDYFLFTDADIEHDGETLRQLVFKAQTEDLDLVSLMVLLGCESFWEKLLIPAFVFFFQKLYPFPWVNNPNRVTAAAAGGCILIRRPTLSSIGGLQAICQELIDDCSLAQRVKSNHRKIWLGLTAQTRSLRPYPSLESLWDTIARTAFTQLNYSPLLLFGTVLGMSLVYLVPPISLVVGLGVGDGNAAIAASSAWLLMAVAYLPTLQLYGRSPFWALALPAIAFLYTLMTIDSALRHWRGKGGAWKGRVY